MLCPQPRPGQRHAPHRVRAVPAVRPLPVHAYCDEAWLRAAVRDVIWGRDGRETGGGAVALTGRAASFALDGRQIRGMTGSSIR